jgi:hypothetical protein
MSVSMLEASALVSRHGNDVYDDDVMSLTVDKRANFAWKEVGYTAWWQSYKTFFYFCNLPIS